MRSKVAGGDSSGGALAPLSAADMMLLDHMGELRLSGRRRLRGFEYVGKNAYHVASVTKQREPLLIGQIAENVTEQIQVAADKLDFELLSFVVMADHVHILLVGRSDGSDLIRFVQQFKQLTGFAYKKTTGQSLWQWSFYDRVVRKDEDVSAMALYIAQNPERAGLIPPGIPWPHAGGVLVEAAPVLTRRPCGAKAPPLLDSGASSGAPLLLEDR